MKIRYCPECAQLVHFDRKTPIQKCWNCGKTSDFSRCKSLDERVGLWLLRGVETTLQSVPGPSRIMKVSRVALVVAMPVVAVMLLVSNSLTIRIVHDLSTPFTMP